MSLEIPNTNQCYCNCGGVFMDGVGEGAWSAGWFDREEDALQQTFHNHQPCPVYRLGNAF